MTDEKVIDFTIVTASYNYKDYITEMLDSVVSQDGVTFEHLVYDGGSTDGTIDILESYEHVHLCVEADGGMSEAINKGFKVAKGRWVMWLNTDDRLKAGALKRVKDYASRFPSADVIYGAWDFIDTSGQRKRRMQAFPFQKGMLSQMCYIASTSTFFRNQTVMSENFYLNEKFKYVMDGEFYNRLATNGKVFQHMPVVLADFRLHGENLSQKYLSRDDLDGVLAMERMFAEERAIARFYGVSIFRNRHFNDVMDAALHYYYRFVKGVLKICHRPSEI